MGIRKIHFARRAALFATFVAFALATGALPSPAAAKPGSGHRGGGHSVKLHKGGHQAYRRGNLYAGLFGSLLGYRPYYARGAYYAPRRRAYVPQYRPGPPYYKPSAYRGYGRACHTVSKIGYDDYGRKAKIGGTMCYDSYGNSYVVKGSRYVIHYY
jgi:hypothetical protein